MRWDKVYTIIRKEFSEFSKSKYVLYSILFMPFVMGLLIPVSTILPLVTDAALADPENLDLGEGDLAGFENWALTDDWETLSNHQRFIIVMAEFNNLMFLLIPIILPTVVAADSFVGEKDRKTAEGLVAAPITDTEIYLGKVLGSLIPTIFATFLTALVVIPAINWATNRVKLGNYLPNANFIGLVFLVGPLVGYAVVNVMIWVSTKTSTTRDASQLGSLVALPFMLIIFGSISATLIYASYLVWVTVGIMLVVNFFLTKIGIGILDREKWVASI